MYCMDSPVDNYLYYNEMLLIILVKINDNVYIFSFEVFTLFIIENKLFVLHILYVSCIPKMSLFEFV